MKQAAKRFSGGNVVLPGDFQGFDGPGLDGTADVAQGDATNHDSAIQDTRDVIGGFQGISVQSPSNADIVTVETGFGTGAFEDSAAISGPSFSPSTSSVAEDEGRFATVPVVASSESRGDDASFTSSAVAPDRIALSNAVGDGGATIASPPGPASSSLANVATSGPQVGDDDSFPQALEADAVTAGIGAGAIVNGKPVATIPQLADFLINGFWQSVGDVAHHFGSSTITYNINGLNAAEKFLAQSALNAWHEVLKKLN